MDILMLINSLQILFKFDVPKRWLASSGERWIGRWERSAIGYGALARALASKPTIIVHRHIFPAAAVVLQPRRVRCHQQSRASIYRRGTS